MRLKTTKLIVTMIAVAGVCLLLPRSTESGEYHNVTESICSDCHTQHSSSQGQVLTPTENLLKNSMGEIGLCMSCHNGTDSRAPDIVSTGTSAAPSNVVSNLYASKYGSSAGCFQGDYLGAANPYGHDLNPAVSVTAPLSSTYAKTGGLVCSDCHDTHGAPNYRNLVSDPNPRHVGLWDILIGTQVKETTPVDASSPNPSVAYDTSNVAFYAQNNISAWCADCHDALSQNSAGSAPAHFKGHPSNVEIGGAYPHADASNWQFGTQGPYTGFGSDVGDSTPGVPRLRYGSQLGSNTTAGVGDTVNCLSCHKAHGSKYKYGLVWPYIETGADTISGCQQCHFK